MRMYLVLCPAISLWFLLPDGRKVEGQREINYK